LTAPSGSCGAIEIEFAAGLGCRSRARLTRRRSAQSWRRRFRGRRGNLLKVIWHDGQGACLFTKRLERGHFIWPSPAEGVVTISSAQLGYLLSGIDCRHPQETWAADISRMRL